MSRIGKLPVTVPAGVDVTIDGQDVTVKGPKGTLSLTIAEPIAVAKNDDGSISVTRPDDERRSRSLHGLSRTLVANLITGVTTGYTTKMEIHGVGYRVALKGNDLEFALGYSHPVPIPAPEGITFAVETSVPSVLGLIFLGDAVRPHLHAVAIVGFAATLAGCVSLARLADTDSAVHHHERHATVS